MIQAASGLNPEQFWQQFLQQQPGSGYCVAYSGGRDSHVLLHLMASLRERLVEPLRAVHVNHGLQEQAPAWAEHCRRVCAALNVPLTVLEVHCELGSGASVEEAARDARYRAFEEDLADDEWLLLAHHQDDQAETVLLRLLRGAGAHGLSAIPLTRSLGRGRLWRPLLGVAGEAIVEYAEREKLSWIEDPSNRDPRFDRNFLRYQLLPQLAERWPGYQAPLIRAAEHARETAELIDALAEMDLECCELDNGLDLDVLRGLTSARQRNVLRLWLRRQGLRPPSRQRLQSGLQALLQAEQDRAPLLEWGGNRLRRYRNRLLLECEMEAPVAASLEWDLAQALQLPGGRLEAHATVGEGLREEVCRQRVEVRFRRGGERCRVAGRQHSSSLKKLLQERGIPPWLRGRLPLIHVDGELAAVADLWVCESFQALPGEPGFRLRYIVDQGAF